MVSCGYEHRVLQQLDEVVSLLTQIHERLTWFIIEDDEEDKDGEIDV